MRAAVMRGDVLVVEDVPEPVPGPGEILVRTLACGICGSDLHALKHSRRMVELTRQSGLPLSWDPARDTVMGHEFAAEVLELGPGADGVRPGDVVVSMPVVFGQNGLEPIGYSNVYPGGYGERMALNAALALVVPNGLDPRSAALTEPAAVGLHAVNRSRIAPGEAALVLGCGPIGLMVIAWLKALGIDPIVASDFSPRRRSLARALGAHEVNDPAVEPAIETWRRADGWRTLVTYEAVGVPGMLDAAMRDTPRGGRILVVGVCMEQDAVNPMFGINKELEIQFVLGYEPDEFSRTLRSIAEGEIALDGVVTGHVDVDGVPGAFEALARPDEHVKILVEP